MRQLQQETHCQLQGMFKVPTCRREHKDPAEEDPTGPEDPACPQVPAKPQTAANESYFCSPQIIEDILRKHEEMTTLKEQY